MILIVKVRDDGPLDINLKAGDIISAYPDSFESSIGNLEKRAGKFAVKVTDPLNSNGSPYPDTYLAQMRAALVDQEFAPGPTPDANRIRRERQYGIPFWSQKFTADELQVIEAGTSTLADGPTEFGGTVAAGVIADLFTFGDIVRK